MNEPRSNGRPSLIRFPLPVAGLVLFAASIGFAAETAKLNVLFLIADVQRTELGRQGSPVVTLPQLFKQNGYAALRAGRNDPARSPSAQ